MVSSRSFPRFYIAINKVKWRRWGADVDLEGGEGPSLQLEELGGNTLT